MQTLLNISMQPDGTLIVTSDLFDIEVKDSDALNNWGRKRIGTEDYESKHPVLKETLLLWRREKSRELNLSAFIILTNRTLLAIADNAPTSADELLAIHGFGPTLFQRYGDEILQLVSDSLSQETSSKNITDD